MDLFTLFTDHCSLPGVPSGYRPWMRASQKKEQAL